MILWIFNVVQSTPTLGYHAQKIKILVTFQKESNISTIDLNNKRLFLLIAATSLYLDYQYSLAKSTQLVLFINFWALSKTFDRYSSEGIDSPS